MIWLVNQNTVSDQHYHKFTSLDQCKITVNTICEGLLFIFFSMMMEKWLKNTPISRLEGKNYTLFMTKMAKIS